MNRATTMRVEASVDCVRPYVACAVLRNISFDKRRYKSFIDLQEKLHQNICRKRTLVAIGTHDLDTIEGPFTYRASTPEDINFVPLTEQNDKSFNGRELLNFYREDPAVKHLKPYTDIIYDSPVYPVIYDNQNRVLSLPPIINGRHSRIQLHTKNVFIECTGTDLTKVNIVLDTVVTMFAEYCSEPFTVESVEVLYPSGEKQVTPLLSARSCEAKVSDINGFLGLNLDHSTICRLCDKMQLGPATYISESDSIRVHVPPTRSDVLHAVDVIEDVGIAYGFNNIPIAVPRTVCNGAPLPINQFSDLLRIELANSGFMEMLTHGLCSTAENFTHLQHQTGSAVALSNPANEEYQVVRTTLIPGALKTLAHNESLSHKNGIRLFEISDVVIPCGNDVGARNERHLVALVSAQTSEFAEIHGIADRIMTCVQIPPEGRYGSMSLTCEELKDRERVARSGAEYFVRPTNDSCFFPGMRAEIVVRWNDSRGEQVVGVFGAVHPNVLENFGITYPCSLVELNVELIA